MCAETTRRGHAQSQAEAEAQAQAQAEGNKGTSFSSCIRRGILMYYKCLWAHWYAAAPELLQLLLLQNGIRNQLCSLHHPPRDVSRLNVGHKYCRIMEKKINIYD